MFCNLETLDNTWINQPRGNRCTALIETNTKEELVTFIVVLPSSALTSPPRVFALPTTIHCRLGSTLIGIGIIDGKTDIVLTYIFFNNKYSIILTFAPSMGVIRRLDNKSPNQKRTKAFEAECKRHSDHGKKISQEKRSEYDKEKERHTDPHLCERPKHNWAVTGPIGCDGGDGLSEYDPLRSPYTPTFLRTGVHEKEGLKSYNWSHHVECQTIQIYPHMIGTPPHSHFYAIEHEGDTSSSNVVRKGFMLRNSVCGLEN